MNGDEKLNDDIRRYEKEKEELDLEYAKERSKQLIEQIEELECQLEEETSREAVLAIRGAIEELELELEGNEFYLRKHE